MIISLTGKPCSGKGTLAKALSEKYDFKVYSVGEIFKEEAKKRGETVKPAEKVAEPQPVYKVRTTKNVSIKTVAKTASWRLESKDDVDKYLAALRENLLKEMDEDTIVNIEL